MTKTQPLKLEQALSKASTPPDSSTIVHWAKSHRVKASKVVYLLWYIAQLKIVHASVKTSNLNTSIEFKHVMSHNSTNRTTNLKSQCSRRMLSYQVSLHARKRTRRRISLLWINHVTRGLSRRRSVTIHYRFKCQFDWPSKEQALVIRQSIRPTSFLQNQSTRRWLLWNYSLLRSPPDVESPSRRECIRNTTTTWYLCLKRTLHTGDSPTRTTSHRRTFGSSDSKESWISVNHSRKRGWLMMESVVW